MANKPVFVITHPRACSTAFERVFMTCRDRLKPCHEPFGDAFYYGPERLGARYEHDPQGRMESGFSESTYKSIFDDIMEENAEERKQIFIKDMAYYLMPPRGQPPSIAPSLDTKARGVGTNGVAPSASTIQTVVSPASESVPIDKSAVNGQANGSPSYPYPTVAEPGNPTVIPRKILEQFHFAFLIRHPKHSIPSYIRCTTPPLSKVTGWNHFLPEEAGYDEQRRIFDWFRTEGVIGPEIADQHTNGATNGTTKAKNEICVIDADDLLDNPEGIMRKFCASVGIAFNPSMLEWDTPEDHEYARNKFEKWRGWHDDAINSTGLVARTHKKAEHTEEELFAEWKEKYGEEKAHVIQDTVRKNLADYEYLKQYAIQA